MHDIPEAKALPASDMREQARRKGNGGLAFVRLPLALRAPLVHAALNIHERSAGLALKRRMSYHAGAAAGVERDQDEAGNVTARILRCWLALLDLAVSPRGPDQPCGLGARVKPSLPRGGLCRRNRPRTQAGCGALPCDDGLSPSGGPLDHVAPSCRCSERRRTHGTAGHLCRKGTYRRECAKAAQPLDRIRRPRQRRYLVAGVQRQHICDRDCCRWPRP